MVKIRCDAIRDWTAGNGLLTSRRWRMATHRLEWFPRHYRPRRVSPGQFGRNFEDRLPVACSCKRLLPSALLSYIVVWPCTVVFHLQRASSCVYSLERKRKTKKVMLAVADGPRGAWPQSLPVERREPSVGGWADRRRLSRGCRLRRERCRRRRRGRSRRSWSKKKVRN